MIFDNVSHLSSHVATMSTSSFHILSLCELVSNNDSVAWRRYRLVGSSSYIPRLVISEESMMDYVDSHYRVNTALRGSLHRHRTC
jgi:hypothetical protein